ncbi:hypothetical protein REPUB_Repub10bG0024200 [Reevesia pubescens]
MPDKVPNAGSDDPMEMTTREIPLKEILGDEVKEQSTISTEEYESHIEDKKITNETSEKDQVRYGHSETPVSQATDEILMQEEDNPTLDVPKAESEDTREESGHEVEQHLAEESYVHTKQETKKCISVSEATDVSNGEEPRELEDQSDACEAKTQQDEQSSDLGLEREKIEDGKPLDEATDSGETSDTCKDGENATREENLAKSLEKPESLKEDTEVEKEKIELPRGAHDQIPEVINLNDNAKNVELALAGFEERPKFDSEAVAEDQSKEAFPEPSKNQVDETSVDVQNRESEKETKEEPEDKLKDEEVTKAVILSEEVSKEAEKVDVSEDIKEHVMEEESSTNELHPESKGDETTNEEDYTLISTECLKEQREAKNSAAEEHSTKDREASFVIEESKERRQVDEESGDPVSVQGEDRESEENIEDIVDNTIEDAEKQILEEEDTNKDQTTLLTETMEEKSVAMMSIKEVCKDSETAAPGTEKENPDMEEHPITDISNSAIIDETVKESIEGDESSPMKSTEEASDSNIEETTLQTLEETAEPNNDPSLLDIEKESKKEEITAINVKEDVVFSSSFEFEESKKDTGEETSVKGSVKTADLDSASPAAETEKTNIKEAEAEAEEEKEEINNVLSVEENSLATIEQEGIGLDSADIDLKPVDSSITREKEIPKEENGTSDKVPNAGSENQVEMTTRESPLKEILGDEVKEHSTISSEEYESTHIEERKINDETSEKDQVRDGDSETPVSQATDEILMQKEDNPKLDVPKAESEDTGEESGHEVKEHLADKSYVHTEQETGKCISVSEATDVSNEEEPRELEDQSDACEAETLQDEQSSDLGLEKEKIEDGKPLDEATDLGETSNSCKDGDNAIREEETLAKNLEKPESLKEDPEVEKEETELPRGAHDQVPEVINLNDNAKNFELALAGFEEKPKFDSEAVAEDQSKETFPEPSKNEVDETSVDVQNRESEKETKEELEDKLKDEEITKAVILSEEISKEPEKADVSEDIKEQVMDEESSTNELHPESKVDETTNKEEDYTSISTECLKEADSKDQIEAKNSEPEEHSTKDREATLVIEESKERRQVDKESGDPISVQGEDRESEENIEDIVDNTIEDAEKQILEEEDTNKDKTTLLTETMEEKSVAMMSIKEECKESETAASGTKKETLDMEEHPITDISNSAISDETVKESIEGNESSPMKSTEEASDSNIEETTLQTLEETAEPNNDPSLLDIEKESKEEITAIEVKEDVVCRSSFELEESKKDTGEEISVKGSVSTADLDSTSPAAETEETNIKEAEAEAEEEKEEINNVLVVEENSLATIEHEGIRLDSADIDLKPVDSSITSENEKEIPQEEDGMPDKVPNTGSEDQMETTTREIPLKEILGDEMKEHSTISSEQYESTNIEERNITDVPKVESEDTGEESGHEVKEHLADKSYVHTEQETGKCISVPEATDVSNEEEPRELEDQSDACEAETLQDEQSSDLGLEKEKIEDGKPLDEATDLEETSNTCKDGENAIREDENLAKNLEKPESLKEDTEVEKEETEPPRGAHDQIPEVINLNDNAKNVELALAGFEEKPKFDSEAVAEDQSKETFPEPSKNQVDETSVDVQNRESEKETKEEPVDKLMDEEVTKVVILPEEGSKEAEKADVSEDIKEHVMEEESSTNELHPKSKGDETTNKEEDYTSISTECLKEADSKEQIEAENSAVEEHSTMEREASLVIEESKERRQVDEESRDHVHVQGEDRKSKENIKEDIVDELKLCQDESDEAVKKVRAETSLNDIEVNEKSNVSSGKISLETTETDANQESKEVENVKLGDISSDLAPNDNDKVEKQSRNVDIVDEDEAEVIKIDPDAVYMSKDQIDEAETSLPLEKADQLPNNDHGVVETESEASKISDELGKIELASEQEVGTKQSLTVEELEVNEVEETKGVIETSSDYLSQRAESVMEDDISSHNTLPEEKPEEQLQPSVLTLASEDEKIRTVLPNEKIEEAIQNDVEIGKHESLEDSSDAKTTEDVCLQKEEEREPKAISEEETIVDQGLQKEELEEQVETTSSTLLSEEREHGTRAVSEEIEYGKTKEKVPTKLDVITGDEITGEKTLSVNKPEEGTTSSALLSKEQEEETISMVDKIDEEKKSEAEISEDSSDLKETAEICLENEEFQKLEDGKKDETAAALAIHVEEPKEQSLTPALPSQNIEHGPKANEEEEEKAKEVEMLEKEICLEKERPQEPEAAVDQEITVAQASITEKSLETETITVGKLDEEKWKEEGKLEDENCEGLSARETEEICLQKEEPNELHAIPKEEITSGQTFSEEQSNEQLHTSASAVTSEELEHETMETEDGKTNIEEIVKDEIPEDTSDARTTEELCSQKETSIELEDVVEDEKTASHTLTENKSEEQQFQNPTSELPSKEEECGSISATEKIESEKIEEAEYLQDDNKEAVSLQKERLQEDEALAKDEDASSQTLPMKKSEEQFSNPVVTLPSDEYKHETVNEVEKTEEKMQNEDSDEGKTTQEISSEKDETKEPQAVLEGETIASQVIVEESQEHGTLKEEKKIKEAETQEDDKSLQSERVKELQSALEDGATAAQILSEEKQANQLHITTSTLSSEVQEDETKETELQEDESPEKIPEQTREIEEASKVKTETRGKAFDNEILTESEDAAIKDKLVKARDETKGGENQSEETNEGNEIILSEVSKEQVMEDKEVTETSYSTSHLEVLTTDGSGEDELKDKLIEDKTNEGLETTQNEELIAEAQKSNDNEKIQKQIVCEDKTVEDPGQTSVAKIETATVTEEESSTELSLAEGNEIVDDIQQPEETTNVAFDERIPRELDPIENAEITSSIGKEHVPIDLHDRVAESLHNADIADVKEIDPKQAEVDHSGEEITDNSGEEITKESASVEDSIKVLSSDHVESSTKETLQVTEDIIEEREAKDETADAQILLMEKPEQTPAHSSKLLSEEREHGGSIQVDATEEKELKEPSDEHKHETVNEVDKTEEEMQNEDSDGEKTVQEISSEKDETKEPQAVLEGEAIASQVIEESQEHGTLTEEKKIKEAERLEDDKSPQSECVKELQSALEHGATAAQTPSEEKQADQLHITTSILSSEVQEDETKETELQENENPEKIPEQKSEIEEASNVKIETREKAFDNELLAESEDAAIKNKLVKAIDEAEGGENQSEETNEGNEIILDEVSKEEVMEDKEVTETSYSTSHLEELIKDGSGEDELKDKLIKDKTNETLKTTKNEAIVAEVQKSNENEKIQKQIVCEDKTVEDPGQASVAKIETTTVTEEEPSLELSQADSEGTKNHAEGNEIVDDIQQPRETTNVASDEQILRELDPIENAEITSSICKEHVPIDLQDRVADVKDICPKEAEVDHSGEEITDNSDEEITKESTSVEDSIKVLSSDHVESSTKETLQVTENIIEEREAKDETADAQTLLIGKPEQSPALSSKLLSEEREHGGSIQVDAIEEKELKEPSDEHKHETVNEVDKTEEEKVKEEEMQNEDSDGGKTVQEISSEKDETKEPQAVLESETIASQVIEESQKHGTLTEEEKESLENDKSPQSECVKELQSAIEDGATAAQTLSEEKQADQLHITTSILSSEVQEDETKETEFQENESPEKIPEQTSEIEEASNVKIETREKAFDNEFLAESEDAAIKDKLVKARDETRGGENQSEETNEGNEIILNEVSKEEVMEDKEVTETSYSTSHLEELIKDGSGEDELKDKLIKDKTNETLKTTQNKALVAEVQKQIVCEDKTVEDPGQASVAKIETTTVTEEEPSLELSQADSEGNEIVDDIQQAEETTNVASDEQILREIDPIENAEITSSICKEHAPIDLQDRVGDVEDIYPKEAEVDHSGEEITDNSSEEITKESTSVEDSIKVLSSDHVESSKKETLQVTEDIIEEREAKDETADAQTLLMGKPEQSPALSSKLLSEEREHGCSSQVDTVEEKELKEPSDEHKHETVNEVDKTEEEKVKEEEMQNEDSDGGKTVQEISSEKDETTEPQAVLESETIASQVIEESQKHGTLTEEQKIEEEESLENDKSPQSECVKELQSALEHGATAAQTLSEEKQADQLHITTSILSSEVQEDETKETELQENENPEKIPEQTSEIEEASNVKFETREKAFDNELFAESEDAAIKDKLVKARDETRGGENQFEETNEGNKIILNEVSKEEVMEDKEVTETSYSTSNSEELTKDGSGEDELKDKLIEDETNGAFETINVASNEQIPRQLEPIENAEITSSIGKEHVPIDFQDRVAESSHMVEVADVKEIYPKEAEVDHRGEEITDDSGEEITKESTSVEDLIKVLSSDHVESSTKETLQVTEDITEEREANDETAAAQKFLMEKPEKSLAASSKLLFEERELGGSIQVDAVEEKELKEVEDSSDAKIGEEICLEKEENKEVKAGLEQETIAVAPPTEIKEELVSHFEDGSKEDEHTGDKTNETLKVQTYEIQNEEFSIQDSANNNTGKDVVAEAETVMEDKEVTEASYSTSHSEELIKDGCGEDELKDKLIEDKKYEALETTFQTEEIIVEAQKTSENEIIEKQILSKDIIVEEPGQASVARIETATITKEESSTELSNAEGTKDLTEGHQIIEDIQQPDKTSDEQIPRELDPIENTEITGSIGKENVPIDLQDRVAESSLKVEVEDVKEISPKVVEHGGEKTTDNSGEEITKESTLVEDSTKVSSSDHIESSTNETLQKTQDMIKEREAKDETGAAQILLLEKPEEQSPAPSSKLPSKEGGHGVTTKADVVEEKEVTEVETPDKDSSDTKTGGEEICLEKEENKELRAVVEQETIAVQAPTTEIKEDPVSHFEDGSKEDELKDERTGDTTNETLKIATYEIQNEKLSMETLKDGANNNTEKDITAENESVKDLEQVQVDMKEATIVREEIPGEADPVESTRTTDSLGKEHFPTEQHERALETSEKPEVGDLEPGKAQDICSEAGVDHGEEKRTDNSGVEITQEPASADLGKLSLSDLLQRSTRDKMQVAERVIEKKELTVNKEEPPVEEAETIQAKEAKTDEEKDEEEEGDEHNKTDSGSDAPVMVEVPRDTDTKPHKKSHNILSNVGSKVKHSISKVRKAITGKSSHSKEPKPISPKESEK